MRFKLVLLLVFQFIFTDAYQLLGQTDSNLQNNIQFAFGATHHRFIDEAFSQSRLKFSGTSFTTRISYQKMTDNHRIHGLLQYGKGTVNPDDLELNATLHNIQLAFSYAKRITRYALLGKESKLYLGPKVSLFDYVFVEESILENASLAFNNTIDVVVVQTTELTQKTCLDVELTFPIAGFQKRDAYDGGANTELENDFERNFGRFLFGESKFSFYNPLSLVRLRIACSMAIGKKTDFTLHYLFNYVKDSDTPPIALYDNGLLAGLKFKF